MAIVTPDVATLGILWTMATKPGWTGSIVAVAGLAIVGALAGYIIGGRRRNVSRSRAASAAATWR